ncbi:MAG: hypothetical protein U5O39_09380 [Gammaproteobacteria bacterium]|nr:hypothetical protein [Gammaproteobacteria bacterium]
MKTACSAMGRPVWMTPATIPPEHWNCYGPAAPLSPDNPPLDRCFQVGGAEDLLLDFNENGRFEEGNGIYNGTLCPLNEDGVTTPDYCTRELVNIRQDLVLLSAGSFVVSAGLRAFGEWVDTVDISPNGPSGSAFIANEDVTANDGSTISAGTEFATGFGNGEVTPGIGETVSSTTSRDVNFFFADRFQSSLPAETSLDVDGGGVCEIELLSTAVTDSNSIGPNSAVIDINPADNPEADSVVSEIAVTTPKGRGSSGSITCIAQ